MGVCGGRDLRDQGCKEEGESSAHYSITIHEFLMAVEGSKVKKGGRSGVNIGIYLTADAGFGF